MLMVFQWMKTAQTFLGSKMFSVLARPTFYNQFVGGDCETQLRETAEALQKANIRLMVCPVQEEDIDEADKYVRFPDNGMVATFLKMQSATVITSGKPKKKSSINYFQCYDRQHLR